MVLAIYGAGGSGKETYDILIETPDEKEKWSEIIFIDDTKENGIFNGCRRMPFEEFAVEYSNEDAKVSIAVGNPKDREILFNKVKDNGYSLANIIHKNVVISASAVLGEGIVLQDGVRISSDARLNNNIYINHRSLVGHDVVIGDNCQISCNVAIAGTTIIEKNVFVGVNVCIRDHLHIGSNSILSMGSIVLKDVGEAKVVMGNPAREIANNDKESVFGR